jgi:hypothetical protein
MNKENIVYAIKTFLIFVLCFFINFVTMDINIITMDASDIMFPLKYVLYALLFINSSVVSSFAFFYTYYALSIRHKNNDDVKKIGTVDKKEMNEKVDNVTDNIQFKSNFLSLLVVICTSLLFNIVNKPLSDIINGNLLLINFSMAISSIIVYIFIKLYNSVTFDAKRFFLIQHIQIPYTFILSITTMNYEYQLCHTLSKHNILLNMLLWIYLFSTDMHMDITNNINNHDCITLINVFYRMCFIPTVMTSHLFWLVSHKNVANILTGTTLIGTMFLCIIGMIFLNFINRKIYHDHKKLKIFIEILIKTILIIPIQSNYTYYICCMMLIIDLYYLYYAFYSKNSVNRSEIVENNDNKYIDPHTEPTEYIKNKSKLDNGSNDISDDKTNIELYNSKNEISDSSKNEIDDNSKNEISDSSKNEIDDSLNDSLNDEFDGEIQLDDDDTSEYDILFNDNPNDDEIHKVIQKYTGQIKKIENNSNVKTPVLNLQIVKPHDSNKKPETIKRSVIKFDLSP